MKYVIDRIEENIAVLEEINTKEKKEVEIKLLPNVKEGDLLRFEDGVFIKDDKLKEERKKSITEKLNRLRRKK